MNGTTNCLGNKSNDGSTLENSTRIVEVAVKGEVVVVVDVGEVVGVVVVVVMVVVVVGVVKVVVGRMVEVEVEVIKVLTNERRTYEKRNAMPHRGVLSDRGRLYP